MEERELHNKQLFSIGNVLGFIPLSFKFKTNLINIMNSATWKECSIHQCGGHTLGLDPVKNRLARQNKKNRMEVLFTLISTLGFYPILNCWNFLARDIEHAQWLTLEEGFMFVKYFLKIGRIKGDCGFQLFSFFFSFFLRDLKRFLVVTLSDIINL